MSIAVRHATTPRTRRHPPCWRSASLHCRWTGRPTSIFARRTAIQFNSQYTLGGYRPNGYGEMVKVAEWQFTSATTDTQNVNGVLVTCRSSYKIEHDFLTEVAARL